MHIGLILSQLCIKEIKTNHTIITLYNNVFYVILLLVGGVTIEREKMARRKTSLRYDRRSISNYRGDTTFLQGKFTCICMNHQTVNIFPPCFCASLLILISLQPILTLNWEYSARVIKDDINILIKTSIALSIANMVDV